MQSVSKFGGIRNCLLECLQAFCFQIPDPVNRGFLRIIWDSIFRVFCVFRVKNYRRQAFLWNSVNPASGFPF